jgi:hypothetical protein
MSDEELFGSAHGEHRSDEHQLRRVLVRSYARLGLRLLLRAQLLLLRKVVLLRSVVLLRAELLLRTEQLLRLLLERLLWWWLLPVGSAFGPVRRWLRLLRTVVLLRTKLLLRTVLLL